MCQLALKLGYLMQLQNSTKTTWVRHERTYCDSNQCHLTKGITASGSPASISSDMWKSWLAKRFLSRVRKRQQQIEEKANEVQFAIFFSWIWKGIFNEKFLIHRKNSEVENPLIAVQFPFNLIWINNICKRISYLEFEADQKRIHRGVNFKYILRLIYTSCLRVHFQCFESTICSFKLPWSRTHLIYYISWPAKKLQPNTFNEILLPIRHI